MWKVFAFLFIVLPFSVFAECVSSNEVTKCARLPVDVYNFNATDGDWAYITFGEDLDDTHWTHERNGVKITGSAENARIVNGGTQVDCVVSEPFNALFIGWIFPGAPAVLACPYTAKTEDKKYEQPSEAFLTDVATALPGDKCPDGFYTVPYNVSCGEGMVDVADVPYCDDDASGEYCLMSASAAPCAAGITTLRTGTGLAIPLWAEKVTTPALGVLYNGMTCYGNLAPGKASGKINVMYDNQVYHLTD